MLLSSHTWQLTSASERVPASSLTCSPLIGYMHHGIPSFAYAMRLGCLAGWNTTRGLPCCRTSPHPRRRRQTCPSAAHVFQLTGHSNWCRFLPLVLDLQHATSLRYLLTPFPVYLDPAEPSEFSSGGCRRRHLAGELIQPPAKGCLASRLRRTSNMRPL